MTLITGVALLVVAGVAHAASSPYGPPTPVLVATSDLAVGHELQPGDLRETTWPRELVPDGANTELTGTVIGTLPRGAIATDRHVASGSLAAAVPDGRVAVTVPSESLPSLPPGAHIDLVATDVDGQVHRVASRATVIASDESFVWVAMDRRDAPLAAAGSVRGALSVILHPP
jgi:Flp pilus assembly protein CpaB